jgi:hypothetical protein
MRETGCDFFVALHTCNSNSPEGSGKRITWVQGQPGLYIETLSQKQSKKNQSTKETDKKKKEKKTVS